jgi:hypothetical protein
LCSQFFSSRHEDFWPAKSKKFNADREQFGMQNRISSSQSCLFTQNYGSFREVYLITSADENLDQQ